LGSVYEVNRSAKNSILLLNKLFVLLIATAQLEAIKNHMLRRYLEKKLVSNRTNFTFAGDGIQTQRSKKKSVAFHSVLGEASPSSMITMFSNSFNKPNSTILFASL